MQPDRPARNRSRAWRCGAALAAAALLNAVAALAAAAQAPPQPSQASWPPPGPRFSVDLTVYGWLPSTHGQISAGPFSVSGNQNFWDADALIGAMVLVDATYGRWRLMVNNVYGYQRFDLSRPILGEVTQRTQLYLFELAGGYDILQNGFGEPIGPPERPRQRQITFGPYAGMRLVWTRNELDAQGLSPATESTNVAPIFGMRGRVDVSERWWLGGGGDLGGAGALRLTWSVYGSVGYRLELFGRPASLMAGYRALGLQLNAGRRDRGVVDLILHGPHLGFVVTLN